MAARTSGKLFSHLEPISRYSRLPSRTINIVQHKRLSCTEVYFPCSDLAHPSVFCIVLYRGLVQWARAVQAPKDAECGRLFEASTGETS
jgi:hypothetical protein